MTYNSLAVPVTCNDDRRRIISIHLAGWVYCPRKLPSKILAAQKDWIDEIPPTLLSLSLTPVSGQYLVRFLGRPHFPFLEPISLCRRFDLRAQAIRHFCRKE